MRTTTTLFLRGHVITNGDILLVRVLITCVTDHLITRLKKNHPFFFSDAQKGKVQPKKKPRQLQEKKRVIFFQFRDKMVRHTRN